MELCQTCPYWRITDYPRPDAAYRWGICDCPKVTDANPDETLPSGTHAHKGEFKTGPLFGCPHHPDEKDAPHVKPQETASECPR